MALAFDGFSIREYASKMRTVDVVKCWPFGGESDEIRKEEMEAFLPPIMVTKFRWWSDELGFVRLAEERSMIFGESSKSENGVVALSDKIDFVCPSERGNEVKSRVKMKAKSRAPKKRSIVEIFAVTPQVEVVDEKDENEDSPEDEIHNSRFLALCDVSSDSKKTKDKMNNKKKTKPELKDGTIGSLKKQKRMIKVKNKGPNKGKDSANQLIESIAKKEKPHKLKLQSGIGFTSKTNISLCSAGSKNVILDDASIVKKKPTVKCLAARNKKLVKTSKLVKHKKSCFHVCGILKNRRKGFSGEHFALCNSQIVSQLNQHSVPQSVRHVRFSDMNDRLRPGRKPSVCPKLPTVHSSNFNGIPAASAKDHEIESGKNLAIPEMNGSDEDDVSLTTKNNTEVQPSSTRKLFGIQNFLNPPTCHEEQLCEGSVTVNPVPMSIEYFKKSKQGYRDGSRVSSYDCSQRFLSLLREGYNPSVNTQVRADVLTGSNYTSDRLIALHSRDLTQTAASASAAACSTEYVQSFSYPPSSYVAINGNENGKLPFTPQDSTVNYPNHVMQYEPFCDLTPNELMHSLHSFPDWKQRAAMGEGKCVDQGFFGLPLNSQGEIIQMNSNSAVTDSCCFDLYNNGDAPTKDVPNMFPKWNGMKENDNLHVSSRIGKSRIQGIDGHCFNPVREPNHSLFHIKPHLKQLKNTCHGHKLYNQNQIPDEKGFQLGNPNDMAVHVTEPTMRLMGKEFTVGRSSKDMQEFEDGKVWTDKKIIAEHRPSNTFIGSSTLQQPFIVSGKLKENVPYLSESQIYQAPQSGLKMKPPASRFSHPYHTHGNRVSTLHPYTPSSVYPLGYMSHLTSKSADMQSRMKLPHATKSSVEFPFLHPDSGEHVRPSWLQNPSTSLPPWLSETQQNGTPIGSFYSYSDVGGRNHPSAMHGSTFQPYPYNPPFPVSAVENSIAPPLMPQCHEFIPIPFVSKVRGERMKFQDRVIRSMSVKQPCQGKKTRKRPAAKTSSYSPKLTNVPNFTVEEESGADTILKASIAAHELDSITDKPGTKKCGQTQIRMTDGIGKAGPSAGAKHILKLNSDTGQDNFVPNVSSIPFVAATSSGRVSESENKLAQIYRF